MVEFRSSLGEAPKRTRNQRLKCDRSLKPASNAMAAMRWPRRAGSLNASCAKASRLASRWSDSARSGIGRPYAYGLALGGVTSAHPALGALNGYDWVVFAGAHMGRHAEQIGEMGD